MLNNQGINKNRKIVFLRNNHLMNIHRNMAQTTPGADKSHPTQPLTNQQTPITNISIFSNNPETPHSHYKHGLIDSLYNHRFNRNSPSRKIAASEHVSLHHSVHSKSLYQTPKKKLQITLNHQRSQTVSKNRKNSFLTVFSRLPGLQNNFTQRPQK